MKNKITILVEAYLDYKRNLGFQMITASSVLKAFARYTRDINYFGPLTRTIVFQWCESGNDLSLITKGRRYEPLKGLAEYAHAFDKDAEFFPKLPYGNPHKRVRPHIYSLEETCLLMEHCDNLRSPDGIRALTTKTAIGLFWSTGLRVAELVNLTTSDVDLENALLTIRSSKFNRDRIIPLSQDVAQELSLYRKKLLSLSDNAKHEHSFFLTTNGNPLNQRSLEYAFQQIRDIVDISDSGHANARLYDFRYPNLNKIQTFSKKT